MKICIISPKYPGKHNKSDYAFVKQLVDAIAALGNDCYVVCPYSVLHYRKLGSKMEHYTVKKGNVWVLSPWYYSFSNSIKLFSVLGGISRRRALQKAFKMMPSKPDVIYGHFWNSAYSGFEFAKKQNIPLFVATGESSINKLFHIPTDVDAFNQYVSGVVCVSSKNRDESIQLGLTSTDKCGVFPNSVNSELFHKRDREECRRQLGLPANDFIVAFVGWFKESKGPRRVADAIKKVGGVKSIFVGRGDQEPDCDGILFKGALPHDQVPLYLGAADCFVLPTQAEGCCNAIVEAMACGLPIISSDRSFNWDVLNDSNSIMVDPNDTKQIADAIVELRDNIGKRDQLSKGALETAKYLTIEQRAKSILAFITIKMKSI